MGLAPDEVGALLPPELPVVEDDLALEPEAEAEPELAGSVPEEVLDVFGAATRFE